MPVVRVDDDVWKWLQEHARPFEDTPNSVLRRIAGLDPKTPSAARSGAVPRNPRPDTTKEAKVQLRQPSSPNRESVGVRVTGEQLNRKYRLGARHALYHKDGTFYERLVRFPAVFCDPRGFVRFDTEQQFTRDQRLAIGDKVNIHRGLASHPRYERFPDSE
jgi:hypothetical protein